MEYRKRTETRYLILHASHTPASRGDIEWYLEAEGRRRGLLNVGYHYVIRQDGSLFEARPCTSQGSHTPGFNHHSIGICLAGGTEVTGMDPKTGAPVYSQMDNFSSAQRETLKDLVEYLAPLFPGAVLKAHSELGRHKHRPVRCPPVDMDQLRKELHG